MALCREDGRIPEDAGKALARRISGSLRYARLGKRALAGAKGATAKAPLPVGDGVGEAAQPAAPAFDPTAFSLIVLFRRGGREALAARLREIASPAHLRRLAEVQHIGLPPSLPSDADAAVLRDAIIAGVLERVENRRAASGR